MYISEFYELGGFMETKDLLKKIVLVISKSKMKDSEKVALIVGVNELAFKENRPENDTCPSIEYLKEATRGEKKNDNKK